MVVVTGLSLAILRIVVDVSTPVRFLLALQIKSFPSSTAITLLITNVPFTLMSKLGLSTMGSLIRSSRAIRELSHLDSQSAVRQRYQPICSTFSELLAAEHASRIVWLICTVTSAPWQVLVEDNIKKEKVDRTNIFLLGRANVIS